MRLNDFMFMILNFYIKHKLGQSALEDLLYMLNLITEWKVFPESFASFVNQFKSPFKVERNYFCTNCLYGYETFSIFYFTYFIYFTYTLSTGSMNSQNPKQSAQLRVVVAVKAISL